MTPVADRLEYVRAGAVLGTRPGRHAGGEWDAWRAIPARTRRRVIGAGYAGPRGMAPDVFARELAPRLEIDPRDVIPWYVRECLVAIGENRRAARARRVRRLARPHGGTEYAYRTALARTQGYATVWQMRRGRGWA